MSVNMQVTALTAALRANFWQAWEETAVEAPSEPFTTIIDSTTRIENYANWTPAPAVQEWDGTNDYGTLSSYIYSIENKIYRASLLIRVPDLDDDQTGALAKKPKEIAVKLKKFPHREVMKALASGKTGTFSDGTPYGLGFDGTAYFATSHAFGSGSNLLTTVTTADASSGSPTAANTYNLVAVYHGDGTSLKSMIWQQRSGPDFRTNSGTDQSDESLQVRSWGTIRGRAAYGMWFNAVWISFTGLPNVSEVSAAFASIEAAFRTFQMPKTRATSFGEYVHEQTKFSSANLTMCAGTALGEVLRQALSQDWAPQGVGTTFVATTNRWKGFADYVISAYLN